jgi:hypothetical protein
LDGELVPFLPLPGEDEDSQEAKTVSAVGVAGILFNEPQFLEKRAQAGGQGKERWLAGAVVHERSSFYNVR